jgi:hypothetical protein
LLLFEKLFIIETETAMSYLAGDTHFDDHT